MKAKSESEVSQRYPTLSDPMDCSLLGSAVRRIFQARVLEWGAIAFSENHLYTHSLVIATYKHLCKVYFHVCIEYLV